MTLRQIIEQANEQTNYQEACYYIVSQLEKLVPDWNKREMIILKIEELYQIKIVY